MHSDFLFALSNLNFPLDPWQFSHLWSEDVCSLRPLEPVIARGGGFTQWMYKVPPALTLSSAENTDQPLRGADTRDYWEMRVWGEDRTDGVGDECEAWLCFSFMQVTVFQIKQCSAESDTQVNG